MLLQALWVELGVGVDLANEVQEAWREFTSTVRSTLVVVLKYDVKRQSLTDAVVLLAVQNL